MTTNGLGCAEASQWCVRAQKSCSSSGFLKLSHALSLILTAARWAASRWVPVSIGLLWLLFSYCESCWLKNTYSVPFCFLAVQWVARVRQLQIAGAGYSDLKTNTKVWEHFLCLFLINYLYNRGCFMAGKTQRSYKTCRTSRLCLVILLRHSHRRQHPLYCDKLAIISGVKVHIK